MDEIRLNQTAELFKLLAHPCRLKILLLLARLGPRNGSFIQELLQTEQSVIARHLIKLKDKGVLVGERLGKEVYYQVHPSLAQELPRLLTQRVGQEPDKA